MKRFIRVYGSGSGSVRHPGLNWPATLPHYSFTFDSEKMGPPTIKLAFTYTSNDKTSKRNLVCSTKLK